MNNILRFILLCSVMAFRVSSFAGDREYRFLPSRSMYVGDVITIDFSDILKNEHRMWQGKHQIVGINYDEDVLKIIEYTDTTVKVRALGENDNAGVEIDIDVIVTSDFRKKYTLGCEIKIMRHTIDRLLWTVGDGTLMQDNQITVVKGDTVNFLPFSDIGGVKDCGFEYRFGIYPNLSDTYYTYSYDSPYLGAPIVINDNRNLHVTLSSYDKIKYWASSTASKSFVVNAVDGGTIDKPFTASEANAIFRTLGTNKSTEQDWYVKGKIASIKEQFGTQYGNATFYISEDGTSDNQFYVYRAYHLGNKKYVGEGPLLKVGDEVVVCGKIVNFRGNLVETLQLQAYVVSINGQTGIREVKEDANSNNTVYDLFGRQWLNPTKGVYIVRGKKYVLK